MPNPCTTWELIESFRVFYTNTEYVRKKWEANGKLKSVAVFLVNDVGSLNSLSANSLSLPVKMHISYSVPWQ